MERLLPLLCFVVSGCFLSLEKGTMPSPDTDGGREALDEMMDSDQSEPLEIPGDPDAENIADALDGADAIMDSPAEDHAEEPALPPFACRRAVMIDNSLNPSTLTDFQVLVDVPYRDSMKLDFADLRFGPSDLSDTFSYWIEEANEGEIALVWVKVPLIEASSITTMYLHYADPDAAYEGDPEAVFIFHDDFESATLEKWTVLTDPSAWGVSESQSRSGSYSLSIGGIEPSHNFIVVDWLDMEDLAVDAWWRYNDADPDLALMVRCSTSLPMDAYLMNLEGESGYCLARRVASGWDRLESNVGAPETNRWIKVTAEIHGTSMRGLLNDEKVLPESAGWSDVGTMFASGAIGLDAWRVPGMWWIDDVRVRKTANPMPGLSMGAEECVE
ncbi:MAG: DUF2341 domain-containing protein [Pseudomonadota bacterium]